MSLQENFMTISETKFSEMAKLSGIDDILVNQYNTHRQSFE